MADYLQELESVMAWHRSNDNRPVVNEIMREMDAVHRECHRRTARCARCVWAWYPVGEYRWRCVTCTAVRW